MHTSESALAIVSFPVFLFQTCESPNGVASRSFWRAPNLAMCMVDAATIVYVLILLEPSLFAPRGSLMPNNYSGILLGQAVRLRSSMSRAQGYRSRLWNIVCTDTVNTFTYRSGWPPSPPSGRYTFLSTYSIDSIAARV